VPVTDEVYDLVLFVVHSFVRPIATELYALKHHCCRVWPVCAKAPTG